MKYENLTDKLVGFLSPEMKVRFDCPPGETIEVPDEVAWRAEAHGLIEVGKKKVVEEVPSGNALIDNYLMGNTRTVVKSLAEDNLSVELIESLIKEEKKGKDRKLVLHTLKNKLRV